MVAKTRVSISHHNRLLVHTYVQGNATPCGLESFQFWKKLKPEILKLIDSGFQQENRGSDEEKESEPLENALFHLPCGARRVLATANIAERDGVGHVGIRLAP